MATHCVKWLPAVFLDGFLALQTPKMATPMEDLHWTASYSAHWNALSGFQCVSMGFFISLNEDNPFQRNRCRAKSSLSEIKIPLKHIENPFNAFQCAENSPSSEDPP